MATTDPLLQTAHDSIGRWVDRAVDTGWLEPSARERLSELSVASPAELFDRSDRPLVVALFGGTGVGKSSLLNRIAGQDIAHASAQRPTSTRVTAYLHRSQSLDRLPQEFPLERLHTALHHEDRWRDLMWLDMPDVDSVATEHRDFVQQWLPHTDVVIYVASPERYRDLRVWSVLRDHVQDHAWLFVFNQFDRGTAEQVDDWRRLLAEIGFADPALFATSCNSLAEAPGDEFDALIDALATLANAHLINELDRRGTTTRLTRLFDLTDRLATPTLLVPTSTPTSLSAQWQTTWADESSTLADALSLRLSTVTPESGSDISIEAAVEGLIDEASSARLQLTLDDFLQRRAAADELPVAAAQRALATPRETMVATLKDASRRGLTTALAQPGTRWQRAAVRCCSLLAGALPALALLWVAWRVLQAFYSGGTDASAYLGPDFAVTASLLVAIAWALPWWLSRRLRPDAASTVRRGLTNGVGNGLTQIGNDIDAQMRQLDTQRDSLATALHDTRREITATVLPARTRETPDSDLPEPLRRLISAP